MRISPDAFAGKIAFLALLLLLALAQISCDRADSDSQIRAGERFLDAGDHDAALLKGLYVLQRHPGNPQATWLVAASMLGQGRDGEAEAYFRAYASLVPGDSTALAELYAARARDDFDGDEKNRALLRWQTALAFDAELDLGPHGFSMGQRAFEDGDHGLAVRLLSAAIGAYPDTSVVAGALYPLGVSLDRIGRWQESLEVLNRFLTAGRRHPRRHEAVWLCQEILIREGQRLRQAGDSKGALELFADALRYRSNPPLIHQALLSKGSCHEDQQDYGQAAACYRRIVDESAGASGRVYDMAISRLAKLEKARLQ